MIEPISVVVPVRIESEMNKREHWTKRKKRFDTQRFLVRVGYAAARRGDADVPDRREARQRQEQHRRAVRRAAAPRASAVRRPRSRRYLVGPEGSGRDGGRGLDVYVFGGRTRTYRSNRTAAAR
jgi:hypothetical protein